MTGGDYNRDSGTIYIGRSKGGKARHIYLSAEGVTFLEQVAAGKEAGDLLLPRTDGLPWQHTHQFRPMRAACEAANITPAIGFHICATPTPAVSR